VSHTVRETPEGGRHVTVSSAVPGIFISQSPV